MVVPRGCSSPTELIASGLRGIYLTCAWKVIQITIVEDTDLSNNLRMPTTVALGLIGTNLDAGDGAERWNRWRPTLSLCQHEDLLIDRLELLHQRRDANLFGIVRDDIRSASPETEVRAHQVEIRDPWDFDEVFGALHD